MNIYSSNGYIDMAKVFALPYPFIFIVGARGTGKTYSACKELLKMETEQEKFLFLRRTADEMETIATSDFSPFQPVIVDNPELGLYYSGSIPQNKTIRAIWHGIEKDGKILPIDSPIGYYGALSTIHKIRGFNMESITRIVYDEFIPEKHVKAIKGEGDALLNAYETINRNRELNGKKPVQLICLANSNNLHCAIFESFSIIDKLDKMVQKGKTECILAEKGIAVFFLANSRISEKKSTTALYKAINDNTDFSAMALNNQFSIDTFTYIRNEPITEYRLLLQYEDVYVYRHKSDNWYYVTRHKSGTPKYRYINSDMQNRLIKRQQKGLYSAWLSGNISFSDFYSKHILTKSL